MRTARECKKESTFVETSSVLGMDLTLFHVLPHLIFTMATKIETIIFILQRRTLGIEQ